MSEGNNNGDEMVVRRPPRSGTTEELHAMQGAGYWQPKDLTPGWIPIPLTRVNYAGRTGTASNTATLIAVNPSSGLGLAVGMGRSGYRTFTFESIGSDGNTIPPAAVSLASANWPDLRARVNEFERLHGIGPNDPVPTALADIAELRALRERCRDLERLLNIGRTDPIPPHLPGQGELTDLRRRVAEFERLHGLSNADPVPTTLPSAAELAAARERIRALEASMGIPPGSSPPPAGSRPDPTTERERIRALEAAMGLSPGAAAPPANSRLEGSTSGTPPAAGTQLTDRPWPPQPLPPDNELFAACWLELVTVRGHSTDTSQLTVRARSVPGPNTVGAWRCRIVRTITVFTDEVTWSFGTLHDVRTQGGHPLTYRTNGPADVLRSINTYQRHFEFSGGGFS